MKILVTGGMGYIGSHTVVELIEEGYEVIIIDDLSNSNIKILSQIEKITGVCPTYFNFDLCDINKVRDFASFHQDIDGIIHFAAFKAVGESVFDPLKYYKNNFYSLINILEVFPKTNFVFSSSCTVYGEPDSLPVNEFAPIKKAESPYGNTKQIAEEILSDFAKVNPAFRVVSLRYFNPVGAHQSALIGELPIGVPHNLVPFITQSAIGKRGAIVVHGNDYPTPDGTAIRDYIHVCDLAKAHVLSIKYLLKETETNYSVFNIGTGRGNSVLEVINSFEEASGVKLNYTMGPRRNGDVIQVYGDVSLAEQKLNWTAKNSLSDMMLSAWKWEQYLNENSFEN